MTTEKGGTEVFIQMWAAWETMVPPALAQAGPRLIMGFLELSARKGGIFQMELKQALGINQPRLSKLSRKLADLGWIELRTPQDDARKRFARATPLGRSKLAALDSALNAVAVKTSPKRKVGPSSRRIRPAHGQQYFDLESLV